MISARTLTRFGMLAVGLGVGVTVASTPGVANADGLDFQISIDGYDLFPTVGNSATASSGMGDIAIAFGNGASASSGNGLGEFAFADGTNAAALAGGGNYNTAIDIGNNSGLIPAGDDSTIGPLALAGAGNDDTAIIIGNENFASASGDILQTGYESSHNIAFVFDPFGAGGNVVETGVNGFDVGNYDFGAVLFDDGILNTGASGADYLYDIVTPFMTEMNAAAAVGAEWWAELMALL